MKFLTYRIQFIILAAWIPIVLALFKLNDNRTSAALMAGAGFVVWPTLFLIHEISSRISRPISRIHLLGCLQFLVFFALPILFLRLANLDVQFNELSLLGISASQLHRFSNISYIVMTVAVVYASYGDRKNKNR